MSATESSSAQTPPRSRRPLAIVLIIMLIAGAGGFIWWLDARNYETTDDAFIDVHTARIAPQVAGRVVAVSVDDNQEAKTGDALIQIDPADYQAKLDQALANQASSNGALAQAKASLDAAQVDVQTAQANIAMAEAIAINAETQLTRNKLLAQKKIVSQQSLDNSVAADVGSEANLESMKKKKASSEAQVKVAESKVESAEADVKSADAQVEQAQLNLSYTKIGAPQDGRVTQKSVAVGDYLQVGQNIMVLVPKEVWVTANFKETQLDNIRPGQPVDINIDAYPEHVFKGHVDSIVSGSGAAFSLLPPENATGNYIKIVQRVPVKIVFDDTLDEQYHLGPGMSVVPTVKVR